MADTETGPKAARPKDTETGPKAARRRFNPLKAHGMISPPWRGAVYEQDGGYFDPSGDLLWEDRPPTPPKKVTHETTVHDASTGETTTTTEIVEVDETAEADPKAVLAAWLKGELDPGPAHGTIRALVKKAYGEVLAKKEEIIDFLVNKVSLVPAEQVKQKA